MLVEGNMENCGLQSTSHFELTKNVKISRYMWIILISGNESKQNIELKCKKKLQGAVVRKTNNRIQHNIALKLYERKPPYNLHSDKSVCM